MKKKILITGCSGYIGSHLCQLLNSTNEYEIHGLDTRQPIVNVDKFYRLDIRFLPDISQKYDAVIHLAALVNVGESETNPILYFETNVNGTINILRNVKTNNFIFASTGAADGLGSVYGISKRAAEDCIKQYCRDVDYTIFRFYNVIGSDGIDPTNKDGLFYNLIKAKTTGKFTIFGNQYHTIDGTCIRDYVHVNEICKGLQMAIDTPSNTIENLGHGVGTSVLQITNMFQQVNNTNFEIMYGPPRAGDLEVSVLKNPSVYMQKMYTLEQLLKID